MKTVFSGIQPTGCVHLGNYYGAINRWISIQNNGISTVDSSASKENSSTQIAGNNEIRCIFAVVDLHALSASALNPKILRQNTLKSMAALLACGIDPKKSLLIRQSKINLHPYLMWILQCLTPMSWLKRMTQFKTKAKNLENSFNATQDDFSSSDSSAIDQNIPIVSAGLLAYPLLQAADILIYKADYVPVGDDQIQHLELARNLSQRFNRYFCSNSAVLFPDPQPIFSSSPKILSLKSSLNSPAGPDELPKAAKMSKSDSNPNSRISLDDNADSIYSKIMEAQTDCLPHLSFDWNRRPFVSNLLLLHSLSSGISIDQIITKWQSPNQESNSIQISSSYLMKQFKRELADSLISQWLPLCEEYKRLLLDPDYLDAEFEKGELKAVEIAAETMQQVKACIGL